MFPTLGHLINYLFGTHINFPMPTYGFVLVMAFMTGGFVLNLGLKRKERLGLMGMIDSKKQVSGPINYLDIVISSAFYFLFAFKIVGIMAEYQAFTKGVSAYLFSLQGCWLAGIIAFAASGYWSYRQAKKTQSPKAVFEEVKIHVYELTMTIVMVAALSGIIGAKIFDILENLDRFFKDPLQQLFSSGGFTFYGGLIVGTAAVFYYIRKQKINALHLIDAAAPAILAAYAVGRLACLLSGDGCWGIPNPEPKPEWLAMLPDWMWAYDFPHNVINEGSKMMSCDGDYCFKLDVPVFPTMFYESVLSFLFFVAIWVFQNRIKVAGSLFFIALILNGFARFFIEKIRVNNVYYLGKSEITQAEIISSLLVIGGLVGLVILYRKARKSNLKV
jgi:prolipoprotein diacylglyceryl transferase